MRHLTCRKDDHNQYNLTNRICCWTQVGMLLFPGQGHSSLNTPVKFDGALSQRRMCPQVEGGAKPDMGT